MSRTLDVIRNKNKIEKSRQERRRNEINNLKTASAFKAVLIEELRRVDLLLEDSDIEGVIVEVPDNSLASFSAAIYSDEMLNYSVEQVDGEPNKFIIKNKYVMY